MQIKKMNIQMIVPEGINLDELIRLLNGGDVGFPIDPLNPDTLYYKLKFESIAKDPSESNAPLTLIGRAIMLTDEEPTCDFCTESCGNPHCPAKEDK